MGSKRLSKAFEYAADLHATQKRKGSEIPYISHLMAVAALVIENGGDEDQAIAALLHDGPEDQGGEETLTEIRDRFGDRVADIASECSDTFEDPKPAWKIRKTDYLIHLEHEASDDTILVSLADKVHNLSCIVRDYRFLGEGLWERFNADRIDIQWYYQRLLQVYEKRSRPKRAQLLEQYRLSVKELMHLLQ